MEAVLLDCGARRPQLKRDPLGGTLVQPERPHRVACVTGKCLLPDRGATVAGEIAFEAREDGVYYTWSLSDATSARLCTGGFLVARQTLPNGADPFEHALMHAIEDIRRYRINRKHVCEPVEWNWKGAA